jgi:hypothetical protein
MADVSATWTSPTGSECVATARAATPSSWTPPTAALSGPASSRPSCCSQRCSDARGVDFTSILAKQRQVVTAISAEAHGQQDKDPPWAYRHIDVVFTVQGPNLDQRAVDRALTLAFEGYCSGGATLAGTATVTIARSSSNRRR